MPRRTDSDRHVPRNDSYMAFHGSGGTNAAHKMSWEVYNGVGAHMGGRPATQHEPIARAMGARSNLREKTEYGNKTLDARRDHRIIDAAGPELFMEAERGEEAPAATFISATISPEQVSRMYARAKKKGTL